MPALTNAFVPVAWEMLPDRLPTPDPLRVSRRLNAPRDPGTYTDPLSVNAPEPLASIVAAALVTPVLL